MVNTAMSMPPNTGMAIGIIISDPRPVDVSTGNKANVDYDAAADFSTYRTYAWTDTTDEATSKSKTAEPLLHKRIRESVDATMATKNIKLVDAASADGLETPSRAAGEVIARTPSPKRSHPSLCLSDIILSATGPVGTHNSRSSSNRKARNVPSRRRATAPQAIKNK